MYDVKRCGTDIGTGILHEGPLMEEGKENSNHVLIDAFTVGLVEVMGGAPNLIAIRTDLGSV